MARRSDHTREELQTMAIQATRALIEEQGIEGVSARKVATSIGYTVGTLYQSFHSIQDLILHANVETLSQLLQSLESAYSQSHSGQEKIECMALAYLSFAQQNQNLWLAVFKLTLTEDHDTPTWFQSKVNELFNLVENSLQQLNTAHSDSDIQKAARILWSSVHGICILQVGNKLFAEDIASPQELIQILVRNFLSTWQQGQA